MKRILPLSFLIVILLVNLTTNAQNNTETLEFDEETFNDLFSDKNSTEISRQLGQMLDEISASDITFDDNAADVPIDGGLGFLLAAGLGYGANKIRNKRKRKQK